MIHLAEKGLNGILADGECSVICEQLLEVFVCLFVVEKYSNIIAFNIPHMMIHFHILFILVHL